jgi:Zn finger protein HypA/HybF involved in hydrogenase expression
MFSKMNGIEVAMARGATGTSMQGKVVYVKQVGKYAYCLHCKTSTKKEWSLLVRICRQAEE